MDLHLRKVAHNVKRLRGKAYYVICPSSRSPAVHQCRTEDEYPVHDRDYDDYYEWSVENYLLQGGDTADA